MLSKRWNIPACAPGQVPTRLCALPQNRRRSCRRDQKGRRELRGREKKQVLNKRTPLGLFRVEYSNHTTAGQLSPEFMPLSNYGAVRGIFRERREEKTVTLLRSRKAHTQPTHAVPGNLAISLRTFHSREARHDQLGLRVGKMTHKICKVFEPFTCLQVCVYLHAILSRINVTSSICRHVLPHYV